jgi:O-6-methylguanine DNA methyltransferase
MQDLLTVSINTVEGCFTVGFSARGVARVEFPRSTIAAADAGAARIQPSSPVVPPSWIELAADGIRRVLSGVPVKVMPPLDLELGTEFQKRVWQALATIPLGQTRSYGQIAAAIGSPRACQAVGAACGANPVPVLIPCHRVLRGSGELGGFTGGLSWKRRLLEREFATSAGSLLLKPFPGFAAACIAPSSRADGLAPQPSAAR